MKRRLKICGETHDLPRGYGSIEIESRPGGWWILEVAGKREKFQAIESEGRLSWSFQGKLFSGLLEEVSSGSEESTNSDSDLRAQFPGKVRKIFVESGKTVKKGEVLLIVEAMKMEFSIRAPSDGRVLKLRVSAGAQVLPGDLYVDFEV
jgi:biotin carboxyl carrier protein